MTHLEETLVKQSFMEHLVELRRRLVFSLYGILVGFAFCYYYSDHILKFLKTPIAPYLEDGQLVFTAVTDLFMSQVRIGIWGGVLVSAPWWIYQIWKFLEPGLYRKEKGIAAIFVLSGTSLFLLGLVFCYVFVLPTGLEFLLTLDRDTAKPLISIGEYLSFVTTMELVFGLAFELPLILTTLGAFGLITSLQLRTYRRIAAVILAIVAAILTPPDVMSMMVLFVPLLLLYEISVWIVWYLEKRKKSQA